MSIGFIYAIECAGRIKIGFSEKPWARFSKICSDAPFPCTLLGFWNGSRKDEGILHQQWAAHRAHSEWFLAVDEITTYVAEHSTCVEHVSLKPVQFVGMELPRGTKMLIATALGIGPAAISQWRRVPAKHLIKVERITGIPRAKLRPDIFGDAA